MNYRTFYLKLNQNLHTLQQREAKYGGQHQAPLALINQIDDHKQAIVLTQQALDGQLTETEWQEQLQPLLLSGNDWPQISLATMLVLAAYSPDNGATIAQTWGAQASSQAGQISSQVLARIQAVQPQITQKFSENPAGYEAPLNDALAELLSANQQWANELKTMLSQYQNSVAAQASGQMLCHTRDSVRSWQTRMVSPSSRFMAPLGSRASRAER